MSKIDWSKAPEWADGHGLVAHHGITEVWINMEQYAVLGAEDRAYPYGGGTGETRHNFMQGQIQYITPRPARWDGEGLPTVGTKCEFKANILGWVEVTITAVTDLGIVFTRPRIRTAALLLKSACHIRQSNDSTQSGRQSRSLRTNACTRFATLTRPLQEPLSLSVATSPQRPFPGRSSKR